MSKEDRSGGEHIISAATEIEEPDTGFDFLGCIGTAFVIAVLFMLAVLSQVRPNEGPSPSLPQPPRPRTATFYSADAAPGAAPIAIMIAGGSYAIDYVQATSAASVTLDIPESRVFRANMTTGKTSGILGEADAIVLYGDLNLRIGEIYGAGWLVGSVVAHNDDVVAASFDKGVPARSPPTRADPARRRIIFVGAIREITIDGTRDSAHADFRLMDLAPSRAEMDRYDAQVRAIADQQMRDKITETQREGRVGRRGR